jgi:hypothetical protein
MLKTGNSAIDFFSQAIVFIPLLPVIIILLRGTHQKDVLTFLLILCLTNCLGSFLPEIAKTTQSILVVMQHLFALVELLILIQMLKSLLFSNIRKVFDIFLISFLSSSLTYYLLGGADQNNPGISRIQDGVIILIGILGIIKLIRKNDLNLFNLPIFWITVGTVFYFVIAEILEAAGCCSVQPISTLADKILLLNIASLIRYFFYALAGLSYYPIKNDERGPVF